MDGSHLGLRDFVTIARMSLMAWSLLAGTSVQNIFLVNLRSNKSKQTVVLDCVTYVYQKSQRLGSTNEFMNDG